MRKVFVALVASALPLCLPVAAADAADCSGTLRASLVRAQVAYALPPPPAGHIYAAQPSFEVAAGRGVPVSVSASRDEGCAVPAASVTVQAREVGRSEFRTIRTGSTNQQGYVLFDLQPVRLTELRVRVTSGGETAHSETASVAVRRAVSAAYRSPGDCHVIAAGSTYPRAAGVPVRLQRRIARNGEELGYLTLVEGATGTDGTYHLSYRAPCGADYALVTYVPAFNGNAAGRADLVDLHVLAAR